MDFVYYFGEETYTYNAEISDVIWAVNYILQKELGCKDCYDAIKYLFEIGVGDSIIEEMYDELKDYFEEESRECYEDAELYNKDPYSYYGVNRNDFI